MYAKKSTKEGGEKACDFKPDVCLRSHLHLSHLSHLTIDVECTPLPLKYFYHTYLRYVQTSIL